MGSATSIENRSHLSAREKSELRLSSVTSISSFRFLSQSTFGGSNRSGNISSSESIKVSGRFKMNRNAATMFPSLLNDISTRDWANFEELVKEVPQNMTVSVRMMLYGVERKLTPFHLLCAFDPPIELMKIVLALPNIDKVLTEPLTIVKNDDVTSNISEISARGQIDNLLPLHVAVLYGASPQIVLALLEVYPGAAKYKNAMGLLPIHIVCSGIRLKPPRVTSVSTSPHEPESNLLETVRVLLRAYPDCVFTPCSSVYKTGNNTPVQYINNVLLKNITANKSDTYYSMEEVQEVIELLSSNLNKLEPISVSSMNSENTDGQSSVRSTNSSLISQSLRVSTVPSGSSKTSISTLHQFCKRNKRPNVKPSKLYLLIIDRKWKEAMARLAKASEEASLWVFLESFTDVNAGAGSLHFKEEFEYTCHRLPMHLACANKPPLKFIQALFEAYPEAISLREKFGMTPLHIACNNGASSEVVNALIKMYPRAVLEKDTFGLLPIHVACTEGAKIDVISLLLKADPATAAAIDHRGNKPIDFAKKSFHPNKYTVIKALGRPAAYWQAGEFVEGEPTFPLYSLLKAKNWEGVKAFMSNQPGQVGKWIIDKNSPWSNGYPCSPLYVACSTRAPVFVVQELINSMPENARATCGQYDMLPLHAACSCGASFPVIKSLIFAYPGGVKDTENFGLLPIHIAITEGAAPDVVRALVQAYPDSVDAKDGKGITPIDYAKESLAPNKENVLIALRSPVEKGEKLLDNLAVDEEPKVKTTTKTLHGLIDEEDWGTILKFVKDHPKEAQTVYIGERDKRAYAQFPIHRVCSMQPPSIVVKALIDAYPTGICSRTDYNEYPLHIACRNGASFGVVDLLLKCFDSAASLTDSSGRTPLHLAAIGGTEPSVLEILLKSARGTANVHDSEGCSALDYLQESHHRNKTFLIKVLERNNIRMNSVSAALYELVKNKKWDEINSGVKRSSNEAKIWVFDQGYGCGRLALHLACSLNPPRNVIAILHNMNPKAVSTMEKDGKYALHVACQHNASVEVVQLLVNTYPDALTIKDKFGLLPIHFACSDGASMEVIKLLLRSAPDSIFQKDTKGWTALDYSELTRADHQHIVDAVSPKIAPHIMRSHSLPPRIDYAKAFGKLQEDELSNNGLDALISTPTEDFPKDPMTKRDIYQTYGFSKSARLLNNESRTDTTEETLPEIT